MKMEPFTKIRRKFFFWYIVAVTLTAINGLSFMWLLVELALAFTGDPFNWVSFFICIGSVLINLFLLIYFGVRAYNDVDRNDLF